MTSGRGAAAAALAALVFVLSCAPTIQRGMYGELCIPSKNVSNKNSALIRHLKKTHKRRNDTAGRRDTLFSPYVHEI
ncbi:Protein of unknown function [Gryllus bimaculatus]|nr:Protein of unknown function [Gryllus bimaculatus]